MAGRPGRGKRAECSHEFADGFRSLGQVGVVGRVGDIIQTTAGARIGHVVSVTEWRILGGIRATDALTQRLERPEYQEL